MIIIQGHITHPRPRVSFQSGFQTVDAHHQIVLHQLITWHRSFVDQNYLHFYLMNFPATLLPYPYFPVFAIWKHSLLWHFDYRGQVPVTFPVSHESDQHFPSLPSHVHRHKALPDHPDVWPLIVP